MEQLPESNKLSIIKQDIKPVKTWKGIVPLVKNSLKSLLYGNDDYSGFDNDNQTYVDASGDINNFKLLISSHVFGRKALKVLVDMGYTNSPAGFGIINKILLSQRNIVFTPYWKGKPYKSKELTLDMNFGLRMLLLTGTCIVYEKEVVGFPSELVILNTLDIEETFVGGKFTYRLYLRNGNAVQLDPEKMIFINMPDVSNRDTQMGLSPFQSALMPIESLKEMYIADTSTLKNKGSDIMLTNDSDTPIVEDELETAQQALNKRIGSARRSGTVAVSTSRLRAINLGKSAKELALWDGYKIKIRDLCNVLQVDSGQFNDPDNKKFSNVVESNRALYSDCVIPFTKLITENPKLKSKLGYDIFLDVSHIDCLQTAQSERAEKSTMVTSAIVGLNEKVKYGVITPEIAIRILVSEWGFDEQEASDYIIEGPAPIEPPVV